MFHFDFTVTEINRWQADSIMEVVIALVEAMVGEVAGGWTEEEDGEEADSLPEGE